MPGEALDADLGAEDAGRVAGRAEDFVVVGTAEGDVADHLRRDRQIRQYLARGTEDGDPALARLRAVEVGHPEIPRRVEGAAVATGAAQFVEHFGLAE